jgi:hypothetical protein
MHKEASLQFIMFLQITMVSAHSCLRFNMQNICEIICEVLKDLLILK